MDPPLLISAGMLMTLLLYAAKKISYGIALDSNIGNKVL